MWLLNKRYLIVHCCTQKTGSQWFLKFLKDVSSLSGSKMKLCTFVEFRKRVIFKKTRFKEPSYDLQRSLYDFDDINITFSKYERNTIYGGFYVGPGIVQKSIASKDKFFFILRDPRDLVISWYYSAKDSHALTKDISRVRKVLTDLDFEEGIKFSIDQMCDIGIFEGVRNWIEFNNPNNNWKVFLYEDLSENYEGFCNSLLDFLKVSISNQERRELIDKHRLKNYKKDESNKQSHYRSGKINQWKDEMSIDLIDYFEFKTNNLGSLYSSKKKQLTLKI